MEIVLIGFALLVIWAVITALLGAVGKGIVGVYRGVSGSIATIRERRKESQPQRANGGTRRGSIYVARRARTQLIEEQRARELHKRRTRENEERQRSDQRRRNDARAQCECRWSTYAPHIAKHFSRADVDRFVRTFMTDSHAAEEVETRAAQLLYILDAFFAKREGKPPVKQFTTIEDVTTWFIEQQARITRLPLDEQTREEHLARLNVTYADLSDRILETPQ